MPKVITEQNISVPKKKKKLYRSHLSWLKQVRLFTHVNPLGAPISPFSSLDVFFLFFFSFSFFSFFDLEGVIWFWIWTLLGTIGGMAEEVGVPDPVIQDAIKLCTFHAVLHH